jgi:hypothetical protein
MRDIRVSLTDNLYGLTLVSKNSTGTVSVILSNESYQRITQASTVTVSQVHDNRETYRQSAGADSTGGRQESGCAYTTADERLPTVLLQPQLQLHNCRY